MFFDPAGKPVPSLFSTLFGCDLQFMRVTFSRKWQTPPFSPPHFPFPPTPIDLVFGGGGLRGTGSSQLHPHDLVPHFLFFDRGAWSSSLPF